MSKVLSIRTPSGLSGDMLVAGLAALTSIPEDSFEQLVLSIGLPELMGLSKVIDCSVKGVSGYCLEIEMIDEHTHRSWRDIRMIIQRSSMTEGAKKLSEAVFATLARAEGHVHGVPVEDVTFHEVGALDSIFDICMASILLDLASPDHIVCSPLPLGDGYIHCAHGVLAAPAPAVQEMLADVPVYGIEAQCETVTPTALAFLQGCGAVFGVWPPMTMSRIVRAYGKKNIPGVPNGAIFSLGESLCGRARYGCNGVC